MAQTKICLERPVLPVWKLVLNLRNDWIFYPFQLLTAFAFDSLFSKYENEWFYLDFIKDGKRINSFYRFFCGTNSTITINRCWLIEVWKRTVFRLKLSRHFVVHFVLLLFVAVSVAFGRCLYCNFVFVRLAAECNNTINKTQNRTNTKAQYKRRLNATSDKMHNKIIYEAIQM